MLYAPATDRHPDRLTAALTREHDAAIGSARTALGHARLELLTKVGAA
jgi:hypothetical protein